MQYNKWLNKYITSYYLLIGMEIEHQNTILKITKKSLKKYEFGLRTPKLEARKEIYKYKIHNHDKSYLRI